MPIEGSGMSSIDSPGSAFAFTKAFTQSPENYYPESAAGTPRASISQELHDFFTRISRSQESFCLMMNLLTMIVSATLAGFLIFALLLETISSPPKD
jgi:hypothetical protein